MSPITTRRWALPLAALLAVGLSGLAPHASADETAVACVDAGNVWVHVEHEEVTGACATEFATATEAMVSTGLAADQGAFFITVDGVTAEDPQWWSLWTASVEDGQLGEWVFAQVGAGDLVPEAGQVIGWRLLEDYNQPQEAPQFNPLSDRCRREQRGLLRRTVAESVPATTSADASPRPHRMRRRPPSPRRMRREQRDARPTSPLGSSHRHHRRDRRGHRPGRRGWRGVVATPRTVMSRPRLPRQLHPFSWWAWALALAAAASMTTNPLLLDGHHRRRLRGHLRQARQQPVGEVVRDVPVAGRLHRGAARRLQDPLRGRRRPHHRVHSARGATSRLGEGIRLLGPVSLESLLAGLYDGLRLATIVVCIGAANALANPRKLLASLPGAFYEAGTVLVVAVSALPQLGESLQRVLRARRLRRGAARDRPPPRGCARWSRPSSFRCSPTRWSARSRWQPRWMSEGSAGQGSPRDAPTRLSLALGAGWP